MILFHAAAIARDRNGTPWRDPKPGAKIDSKTQDYAAGDLQDATHGSVALRVLDLSLASDTKAMQAEPAKWVGAVLKREEIARRIKDALAGDGWAEIDNDWGPPLQERLAECAVSLSNALIGPVLYALTHPPKSKPIEADRRQMKGNGGAVTAEDARNAP